MTPLRLNFHPSISVSCRCPTCYRSIISHASYPPILASFPSLLFCSSSFLPLRAYNWLLPPCTSFSMIDHDYATNTTITILHHTHARIYLHLSLSTRWFLRHHIIHRIYQPRSYHLYPDILVVLCLVLPLILLFFHGLLSHSFSFVYIPPNRFFCSREYAYVDIIEKCTYSMRGAPKLFIAIRYSLYWSLCWWICASRNGKIIPRLLSCLLLIQKVRSRFIIVRHLTSKSYVPYVKVDMTCPPWKWILVLNSSSELHDFELNSACWCHQEKAPSC